MSNDRPSEQPETEPRGLGCTAVVMLPVGTRIKFLKTLHGDADDFQPAHIYARKGDGGVITGHGTVEGYWVKWDHWPHAFGAQHGVDFEA